MYPLNIIPMHLSLEVLTACFKLKASEHHVTAATHLGGTQWFLPLLHIFFGGEY